MQKAAPCGAACCSFAFGRFAADRRRAAAATAVCAVTHELLHALSGIDLAGIDVALAVEADLKTPVEITGHPAAMAEPPVWWEPVAAQDVDRLVGVFADIEILLRLVGREVHRHRCAGHHRLG